MISIIDCLVPCCETQTYFPEVFTVRLTLSASETGREAFGESINLSDRQGGFLMVPVMMQ